MTVTSLHVAPEPATDTDPTVSDDAVGQSPATPSLAQVIGRNVARGRRNRGWSQTEAGRQWGTVTGRKIGAQSWSLLERGRRAFSAADIEAAAVLFGTTPAELVTPSQACDTCADQPPAGFICAGCGLESPRAA